MKTTNYARLYLFACTLLLALTAGCATSDAATETEDAAAKRFEAATDMANIYIYRDDNVMINTPISVSIDGQLVGVTGNDTFILTTVEPGEHRIVAKGENTDELVVNAKAGENLFVQLGVGLGAFTNRANLILMDEDQGMEAVRGTRLLK